MEERKKMGSSSSSSFTSDLFGSKDSPSPSSGIFGSIFAPPSKVLGRESLRPAAAKSQHSPNEPWNYKPGASGNTTKGHEGENANVANNRDERYKYQDQQVQQPCHLSSSIYYGGQDVYPHPPSSQGSGLNSSYNNDGGEDDLGIASRGNWWQGSLYY